MSADPVDPSSVRALSTLRAQRLRVFDNGSWSALATAVGSAVVAGLSWLFYALSVTSGSTSRSTGAGLTIVLAIAITASAFCAAFSAATLVLRTLQRYSAIEE